MDVLSYTELTVVRIRNDSVSYPSIVRCGRVSSVRSRIRWRHGPQPAGDPARRPADAAFLSLRSAIVEAALPPGTRLPEDLLAQQYGVSRTLIRGTLARLTAAGLVETGKAKSALVADPSLTEAKETFEVRRCLEREAVRRIASRGSRRWATP